MTRVGAFENSWSCGVFSLCVRLMSLRQTAEMEMVWTVLSIGFSCGSFAACCSRLETLLWTSRDTIPCDLVERSSIISTHNSVSNLAGTVVSARQVNMSMTHFQNKFLPQHVNVFTANPLVHNELIFNTWHHFFHRTDFAQEERRGLPYWTMI